MTKELTKSQKRAKRRRTWKKIGRGLFNVLTLGIPMLFSGRGGRGHIDPTERDRILRETATQVGEIVNEQDDSSSKDSDK